MSDTYHVRFLPGLVDKMKSELSPGERGSEFIRLAVLKEIERRKGERKQRASVRIIGFPKKETVLESVRK